LKPIDVLILAGGFGTRLKKVLKNKPKCLAMINGKPFIDLLIDNCISKGLKRFIISVGYQKNQIIEHLQKRNDCELVFSSESEPMGTGGAIKLARKHIKSNCFIVMNGDSFLDISFEKFYEFHYKKGTIFTMAGVVGKIISDYGSILIDNKMRILDFTEKKSSENDLIINAGIYLFNKEIFDFFPKNKSFSIEKDFFSYISKINNFYVYCIDKDFFDIGTPKRLIAFQKYFKEIQKHP
tara:strand:- start:605 stop:1318 length:714 start_codon:yes stop_codon:yes gene_type:complete